MNHVMSELFSLLAPAPIWVSLPTFGDFLETRHLDLRGGRASFELFISRRRSFPHLIPLCFMDTQSSDPEKSPRPDNDIEAVAIRTVAFPEDDLHHRDEKQRQAGVEMKRQLTQEDIRLAEAGYEHLAKDKSAPETKFGDVDITEHSLPIHEIEGFLHTSFNWADPAQSRGLTADEAEARLKRDGPNMLTPPKKKSALQKVCFTYQARVIRPSERFIVLRLSQDHVQHHFDYLRSS